MARRCARLFVKGLYRFGARPFHIVAVAVRHFFQESGNIRRRIEGESLLNFSRGKLTKIPMQMVWGDNVDKSASSTNSLRLSKLFAEKINKYGGKAQVLMLPDAGLKGNTHIPFADMNNVAVADLLSKFLSENGLDKR